MDDSPGTTKVSNLYHALCILTSRAPYSGFSTVPMMDYAVRSCGLPLERFASTAAIVSYGSLRIAVVWSRNHRFVTCIQQQALPVAHMTVAR